jgi:hypothetical protein
MRDGTNTIEIAAPTNGDVLPEDYWLARESALSGSIAEARRINWQVLDQTDGPTTRAMLHNGLAALAAAAGDRQEARKLLEEAIRLDPECQAARENWASLGVDWRHGLVQTAVESRDRPVKVAVVSAMFNWPSSGGGNVHTVQLAMALQNAGCEVRHIFLRYPTWSIGKVEENSIPSQAIGFSESDWSLATVQDRVRNAVREYAPDYVLLTDSWSLKPWLAEAVSDFPYLLRFDGLECMCPLNNLCASFHIRTGTWSRARSTGWRRPSRV